MMEAQAVGPVMRGNRTANLTAFRFGAVTYFTFLFTILYATKLVPRLAAATIASHRHIRGRISPSPGAGLDAVPMAQTDLIT
jgi:hypothetical protein